MYDNASIPSQRRSLLESVAAVRLLQHLAAADSVLLSAAQVSYALCTEKKDYD